MHPRPHLTWPLSIATPTVLPFPSDSSESLTSVRGTRRRREGRRWDCGGPGQRNVKPSKAKTQGFKHHSKAHVSGLVDACACRSVPAGLVLRYRPRRTTSKPLAFEPSPSPDTTTAFMRVPPTVLFLDPSCRLRLRATADWVGRHAAWDGMQAAATLAADASRFFKRSTAACSASTARRAWSMQACWASCDEKARGWVRHVRHLRTNPTYPPPPSSPASASPPRSAGTAPSVPAPPRRPRTPPPPEPPAAGCARWAAPALQGCRRKLTHAPKAELSYI